MNTAQLIRVMLVDDHAMVRKGLVAFLKNMPELEGEIRVSHVVINGTVAGPVHALEYLELQNKSKVTGDVYYESMEIQLGAVVEGNLVHRDSEFSDKVVAFKPAAAD